MSPIRRGQRNCRILCIDDYAPGLEVRKALLEHWGYTVLTASTGEEALQILKNRTIHGIVLDYCLPGMNGGEILKKVKAEWPHVRVVLLSGYPRIPHRVKNSADCYMRKGDPNEQLRRALAELFGSGTRQVVVQQTRKLVARAGAVLRRSNKKAG